MFKAPIVDWSKRMPHFYFHLVSGDGRIQDLRGIEVPEQDLSLAIENVLDDLRAEKPTLFEATEGWWLEVVDEQDQVVTTVPLTRVEFGRRFKDS
jgi:hypothetical protein